jgi:hypothetical protein
MTDFDRTIKNSEATNILSTSRDKRLVTVSNHSCENINTAHRSHRMMRAAASFHRDNAAPKAPREISKRTPSQPAPQNAPA